jgi:hypothetical protein
MLSALLIAIAFWLCAALTGAMLFFGAVIAPAVFRTLGEAEARALMRVIFPRYYLVLGAVCLGAALVAAVGGRFDAGLVLCVVAAGFGYARQSMLPRLNAMKDKALTGDEQAETDFERAHRMSTTLNMVQLLALLAVAYGLARGV